MSLYDEISREVEKIPVIDTHEHLPHDEEERERPGDVLREYLSHYMSSDMISAGLGRKDLERARDSTLPVMERWKIVGPYWELCRHIGYGRALDIAVRKIYGIDGITGATIEELNSAFKKRNVPGHFKFVLKDLCGIKLSILDAWTGKYECAMSLFRRVWQPQSYIIPVPAEFDVISWLESEYGIAVHSLDDWMEAFTVELEDYLSHGIVALKTVIAYFRSLKFEKVDYSTARYCFSEAYDKWEQAGNRGKRNIVLPVEVQDFMMHYILKVANEKNLTFQFHTGLFEGNCGVISNSDPALMSTLFNEYPNVNFDLFHMSYPYQSIASTLAKTFPNVFVDMCWAHIISPSASVMALNDFLDAIPYNKIMGFGGDYLFVDGICGHLQLARENISKTLSTKVGEGHFSVETAVEIARKLLYENPARLFKLETGTDI